MCVKRRYVIERERELGCMYACVRVCVYVYVSEGVCVKGKRGSVCIIVCLSACESVCVCV
jgi:hypothetical protein